MNKGMATRLTFDFLTDFSDEARRHYNNIFNMLKVSFNPESYSTKVSFKGS